jgi:hypothetical protein
MGPPESLLPIFRGMLERLAQAGYAEGLNEIPFVTAEYDASIDGPRGSFEDIRWVVTTGYDTSNSFFEIDEQGHSSRSEIFLATPFGFLEVGVFGSTGWNRNPDYILRNQKNPPMEPDLRRSGLGVGLERLLLCEQIVSITRRPT